VGTILFVINHLDTVLAGAATTQTWIKIAVTYLVPSTVANIGLLLGSRRPPTNTNPSGLGAAGASSVDQN